MNSMEWEPESLPLATFLLLLLLDLSLLLTWPRRFHRGAVTRVRRRLRAHLGDVTIDAVYIFVNNLIFISYVLAIIENHLEYTY